MGELKNKTNGIYFLKPSNMNKITGILLIVVAFAASTKTNAQDSPATGNIFTLQQCVETAFKNNADVKQAELLAESARINYNQSKTNMLPDLNAGVSHSAYNGRSINPYTNSYINEQNNAASYSLQSNIVLWNGCSLHNYMKQNELNYEAGKMDAQNAKDKITISIILNYLFVLSTQEQLNIAQKQVEATRRKVELLVVKNNQGAISPADLYDMNGQLANDELSVVSTKNSLETAKLTLAQLMNVPYTENMTLIPVSDSTIAEYGSTISDVYENALNHLALVKSADLKVAGAAKSIKAIRGQMLPTLYLSGGLYTNYSSTANTRQFVNTTDIQTSDYVMLNNAKNLVYSPLSTYNAVPIKYGTQLGNNFNSVVSLGLQIPLLNGLQVRNKLNQAKVAEKQLSLQAQNTRDLLRKAIEQDFVNMNSDYLSYKILLKQVGDFQQSFRAAEIRFEQGDISTIDFVIAKNNLDRVLINLVSIKYNYLLRTRLLDFYQDKALW
jgi:outer membrane protein